MADRLMARQALEDSAAWLRSAESLWNSDHDRVQAQVAALMAQAYATFAQAAAVVDGTVDVRARVESGI